MTKPLDFVVRCFEVFVRDEHNRHLQTCLELCNVGALLVEQITRNLNRNLGIHGCGVVLHGFFLKDAQDVESARIGIANDARSVAARAGHVRALIESRPQPLAREFHEAEARNLAHLNAGSVVVKGIAQSLLDLSLGFCRLHVDEVNNDESSQVTQTELAPHLVGCLEVSAKRCLLDVGATR